MKETKKISLFQEQNYLKVEEQVNQKDMKKALDAALGKLPNHLSNFVKMQLELNSKKSHGRRCSNEMKSLAISLYHASGKAYRLLSKLFILPTKSSLRRFISKIPMDGGIPQATLNLLKQKISHMNGMEKLCTLCLDEVSLKTHLFYSISDDQRRRI